MIRVFVDGGAGTTGLRILDRLSGMADVRTLVLPEESRKDPAARRDAILSSDVTFLCLPDDAAREAVSLAEGSSGVLIDASTAHRTDDGWAYGLPELSRLLREKIMNSKRVAVPGCHASGFIATVYPLVEAGLVSETARLSCTSLTGYSGGGKKMIADYEGADRSPLLGAPRVYGLGQTHKHLPEMKKFSGLRSEPVFTPVVADFYSGMLVTVPLTSDDISGAGIGAVREILREKYRGPVIKYVDGGDGAVNDGGFSSAAALSGTDSMKVTVFGNDERMTLAALYDNLGKGASGAAVQCMNLVTGRDETESLVLA